MTTNSQRYLMKLTSMKDHTRVTGHSRHHEFPFGRVSCMKTGGCVRARVIWTLNGEDTAEARIRELAKAAD